MAEVLFGIPFGFLLWFFVRYGVLGFYTVGPNERAVLSTFGRAQRLGGSSLEDPIAQALRADERDRYKYPQVRVIGPGFYWKLPWQNARKVSVATNTVSIAYDPEDLQANSGGRALDAVTKDQLNTGLTGQLRFTISERNLYAYVFGVKNPVAHIMGYFVSVLRDRIANFEAPDAQAALESAEAGGEVGASVQGISINDLRKNLRDLNDHMAEDCASAAARYGISLDAALITGIDPPLDVDSALAAINTAHNHVSSEISLAQAAADQIVQSRRAVEIETLNAQAEVEPLLTLAAQLRILLATSEAALSAYVRNAKLGLRRRTRQLVLTAETDTLMLFLTTVGVTFALCFVVVPILLFLVRVLGVYVVVQERQCVVFELFGRVRLIEDQPGLHFPWLRLGPFAPLVPFFGKKRVVDLRLDQTYLRSQPVNSEEGAPMGIGVWCEMFVSDPLAYLYKNWDPVGSLRANVSNATVRCLSNMKLSDMLETRHAMSQVVREEVSNKSREWGYMLGSTYIRKVHFRDLGMIQQIEQKVVNRLRQVTAAIQQDGANRVNVIRSTAERQAAVAFAQAAATRPRIVGAALGEIAKDASIAGALFELLETQNLLQSPVLEVSVLPAGTQFVAAIPSAVGTAVR